MGPTGKRLCTSPSCTNMYLPVHAIVAVSPKRLVARRFVPLVLSLILGFFAVGFFLRFFLGGDARYAEDGDAEPGSEAHPRDHATVEEAIDDERYSRHRVRHRKDVIRLKGALSWLVVRLHKRQAKSAFHTRWRTIRFTLDGVRYDSHSTAHDTIHTRRRDGPHSLT
eukprot:4135136-Pyramimonas_sp.AAC.1